MQGPRPVTFDLDVAYYSQWGKAMASADLTVGARSLNATMTNAAGTVTYFDSSITFFVDASGTGACL